MPGSGLKTGFLAAEEITVAEEVLQGFLAQLPSDLQARLTAARMGSPHQPGALQLQAALILGLQGLALADLIGDGATGKRRRGRPRKGEEPPKPAGPPERRLALEIAVKVSGELRHLQKALLDLRPEGGAPRTGTYHWKDPIRVERDAEGRARYAGPASHPQTRTPEELQAEVDALMAMEKEDQESRRSDAADRAAGDQEAIPETPTGTGSPDAADHDQTRRRQRKNRGRKRAGKPPAQTVIEGKGKPPGGGGGP